MPLMTNNRDHVMIEVMPLLTISTRFACFIHVPLCAAVLEHADLVMVKQTYFVAVWGQNDTKPQPCLKRGLTAGSNL